MLVKVTELKADLKLQVSQDEKTSAKAARLSMVRASRAATTLATDHLQSGFHRK